MGVIVINQFCGILSVHTLISKNRSSLYYIVPGEEMAFSSYLCHMTLPISDHNWLDWDGPQTQEAQDLGQFDSPENLN